MEGEAWRRGFRFCPRGGKPPLPARCFPGSSDHCGTWVQQVTHPHSRAAGPVRWRVDPLARGAAVSAGPKKLRKMMLTWCSSQPLDQRGSPKRLTAGQDGRHRVPRRRVDLRVNGSLPGWRPAARAGRQASVGVCAFEGLVGDCGRRHRNGESLARGRRCSGFRLDRSRLTEPVGSKQDPLSDESARARSGPLLGTPLNARVADWPRGTAPCPRRIVTPAGNPKMNAAFGNTSKKSYIYAYADTIEHTLTGYVLLEVVR